MTGFCIHELITSVDHPHPWDGERQIGLDPDVSVIITVTPAYAILVESSTQFAEYEPGKGITEKEGWGQISGKTLWIAEDTSASCENQDHGRTPIGMQYWSKDTKPRVFHLRPAARVAHIRRRL